MLEDTAKQKYRLADLTKGDLTMWMSAVALALQIAIFVKVFFFF